ncbi:MAG: YncE family protein [Rhodospirillaceae bacterium]
MTHVSAALALLATAAFAAGPALSAEAPSYKISKSVPLGSPDGWDYVTFEPETHRVYVAHANEITVVDSRSGDILGRVQGVTGVNGVAVVPSLNKGYADSRAKKAAVAFDLTTFKVLKDIPADEDTDGMVFEPMSKRVLVVNGDAGNVTIIDTATDTPVANLPLGGKPEFLVSDDAGHVFINITDKKEIVRVDARAAKVDARWPISDCEAPHGLAIDRANHRLFATCVNAKMVVVDAEKGTVFATLPIGKGSDGAAFDSKRRLAFSSNGEGTVSVISELAPDKFVALTAIPSRPFARTMAVDSGSGRIFLVTADLDEVNPKAENLRQRYQIKRGTVQLLFLDPS